MSEERGGPAGKGDPTLRADGREVGSVPGITEKGEGVDHKGRAGLRRVAGSSDLPLGVLVGSDQGWAQSPQLDSTWKLRGECHKIGRTCSLLLKAARPSPASLQSVSEPRDGGGCPAPSQRRSACFHGQRHSTSCSYASLLGRTPSSLFCQNKRRKKKNQWKGSSSGVGLSPSFRVAEAGSPKPPLWHVRWAPLLLHHRVLGPAAASSARAGRREEAAVLWRRSGSRTARTSLALQSIAPVWDKLIPPGRWGKPASPWFSYTYTMRQESLTKQKLTLPGRSKESHGDVQGKGFWRETRRALRSSE